MRAGAGDDTFSESNVFYANVNYEFGDGFNNVACLSDIVAGGCTFTGFECVEGAGTPLEHLHDFIAIVQAPDEVFLDPNGGGCGHGEVVNGVVGCGSDVIPPCVE